MWIKCSNVYDNAQNKNVVVDGYVTFLTAI